MGQKVNPHGLRVGIIKDWESKWYAEKDFADNLVEDHEIREFLKKKLYSTGISKIEIERASDRVKVSIYTAKPGLVIGKGGAEIEKLKGELTKKIGKKVLVDISLNCSLVCAVHCVVLEHVCKIVDRAEVVDSDDLNVLSLHSCAEDEASDSTKTINTNFHYENPPYQINV